MKAKEDTAQYIPPAIGVDSPDIALMLTIIANIIPIQPLMNRSQTLIEIRALKIGGIFSPPLYNKKGTSHVPQIMVNSPTLAAIPCFSKALTITSCKQRDSKH